LLLDTVPLKPWVNAIKIKEITCGNSRDMVIFFNGYLQNYNCVHFMNTKFAITRCM